MIRAARKYHFILQFKTGFIFIITSCDLDTKNDSAQPAESILYVKCLIGNDHSFLFKYNVHIYVIK